MLKEYVYLLVDDDEDDHELFKLALDEVDPSIRCELATNGQEALDLLKNKEVYPDYIFLDLNMPLMGGKDCLAILKSDHDLSHIPVIIFTTSSDPKDKVDTAELGAMDFITKPAKISELVALLHTFTSRIHTH